MPSLLDLKQNSFRYSRPLPSGRTESYPADVARSLFDMRRLQKLESFMIDNDVWSMEVDLYYKGSIVIRSQRMTITRTRKEN